MTDMARVLMSSGGGALNQYRLPVDRGVGKVAQRVNMLDIPRQQQGR